MEITDDGYSYEADWWSYGILIYELLTGCLPFYIDCLVDSITTKNIMLKAKILNDEPDFSHIWHITDDYSVVDLIKQLLIKNPAKRLGNNINCFSYCNPSKRLL